MKQLNIEPPIRNLSEQLRFKVDSSINMMVVSRHAMLLFTSIHNPVINELKRVLTIIDPPPSIFHYY